MRIEWQVAFWLLMLVLASLGLYKFASVLAPFVAALILGYVLDPVADRLEKIGLSRLLAKVVIVAAFVVVLTIVIFVLAPVWAVRLWDSPKARRFMPPSCKPSPPSRPPSFCRNMAASGCSASASTAPTPANPSRRAWAISSARVCNGSAIS
uniref:ORF151 n=1 Tax=Rhodoblastus acidophilus TaxID=1074 RepID=Q9S312_RHOAC|nr:unnamed protein product [Rhodoblastus acidophilus]